ncbi:MAG: hypothetical protein G01um101420_459 [Parcubacteria group bacterium Gr01-1014_20]|nr:MAG: hypothetical protein G01um101420_459 [Parcubacteria group bacterium Gr01-1014_20]
MKKEQNLAGIDSSSAWDVPPLREAVIDSDGSAWDRKTEEIIEKYKRIIVLRGAGSVNGIDKKAADELLEKDLLPRIKRELESGAVAIMFDGDSDSPDKPDVGYIMGRLRDELRQELDDSVLFATAQKKSWYYPAEPGTNLANTHGLQYETYVFEDGKFPGEHNRFTQSERLVNADGYEQWYIGASGPIASEQLQDYNAKIEGDKKHRVVVFRAPLNEALSDDIAKKLEAAKVSQDQSKITKLEGALEQRKHKYGVPWDDSGNPIVDASKYPHLEFEFVTK